MKVNLKEILVTILIAVVTTFFIVFINKRVALPVMFTVTLFLLAVGMNVAVYLIKRFGAATLFFLVVAILTFTTEAGTIKGWKKVVTFFLAGLIFEATLWLIRKKVDDAQNISLGMIVGTTLSILSIPLIFSFLLSARLAGTLPASLLNLVILAFLVGLSGSLFTSLVWSFVGRRKIVLKFQTYLRSLNW